MIELLKRLSPTARLLILCRVARSVGQGALVVDFALYMRALHWDAVDIGGVYMGGLLLGAALTMISGPLSDRFGRKPFLFWYGVSQVAAAAMGLATSDTAWLVTAAVVGAFGRGANGAAGPFGPVEQAWLADQLEPADFGPLYSLNTAVGFGGMAAGALAAVLPDLWAGWLPGPLRFRPLFLFVLFGALITLWLLPRMIEVRATDADAAPAPQDRTSNRDRRNRDWAAERRQEHGMLAKLAGINALNGLAAGVMGPFMAYWFQVRYGAGPGAIGPVMALGFVLSCVAALGTGWLTRRISSALAVVVTRLIGVALLAALPFAPTYGLAAACYVLRAAFNRGSAGARQAVGLKLVGAGRRGLAASLNAASMQIPRALGPLVGGALLDAGLLTWPMLIAAALQTVYLALYGVTFRRLE